MNSTILLIDDEEEIQITFQKILEKEGYTVKTASTLAQTRENLKNHQIDTIITDIIIPGTSGIEVLKTVKENTPEIPVIMITGEPSMTTAIESVRQGAYDYLSKPISRYQLLQVVAKAVEKKWLIDERERLTRENLEYRKNLENKVKERTLALHELNAFINNIIESIPSLVITLNLKNHITMVNSNVLDLFHWKNKAEIIGKDYHDLFPRNFAQAIEKIIHQQDWNFSYENELADQKTIGYNVSPLMNKEHKIIGRVIIVKDISQKKKLEQELIQSEKLATLGLLAGKISHEMGNPLFGILGYAELLESKYPGEEDIKYIINQANRLKKMIKDLLTISKPKPPHITSININTILKQTVEFLRGVTGQIKYHQIIQEYSSHLPPVHGDEEQLKQVFMNLMVNASQAMKGRTEKDTLTITTAIYNGNGDSIAVCIQDTGCGIAPENVDHIFEPFYTTKGKEGTGLGMSVVKEIVGNHHGRIYIESQPGEGTKVSVILPVKKVKAKNKP